MLLTTAALCAAAFAAGFIDAIAGGGGLVQLPALLLLLPGVPIPTLLGTSKLSGFFGTASAAIDYARRRVEIRWHVIVPAALASAAMSWIGAHSVSRLPREAMRPMVLVLLLLVAGYTLLRRDFGAIRRLARTPRTELLLALAGSAAIGFYDGFFGPGTGSFLIFFLISTLGYDFLMAVAAAKVLNLGSNLTAIGYFAATDQMLWQTGLAMGVCNILGARIGTRLTVTRGVAFVRPLFLTMLGAAILRMSWDTWQLAR